MSGLHIYEVGSILWSVYFIKCVKNSEAKTLLFKENENNKFKDQISD